jgi:hypothetical protein
MTNLTIQFSEPISEERMKEIVNIFNSAPEIKIVSFTPITHELEVDVDPETGQRTSTIVHK